MTLVIAACSSGGSSGTNDGDGASSAVLHDCPPCWQMVFCYVPPDLTNNFFMTGASEADGSCTLSSTSDSGESIIVPLECGAPSNPSVSWSVSTASGVPTLFFDIPSKGTVDCQQT
jgi:hypothetical protein